MGSVALFSGGLGSWAAVRRYIDRTGTRPVLLFTDTLIEDDDLYRFLPQAAADLECELVRIADGRTPWQVFAAEGMIGNTRADLCSRILKRDLARAWIEEHCQPGADVVIGIDWTEMHRFTRAAPRWTPFNLVAPMVDAPWAFRDEIVQAARDQGLEPPRLYDMGFAHNNCGGFCVKQGHRQFAHLLSVFPDRFAEHERQEAAFRAASGKDVAILRDRRGGDTKPFTLRALRESLEGSVRQCDWFEDAAGCGCGF